MHNVFGFIGKQEVISASVKAVPQARVVPLPQGMALVPITEFVRGATRSDDSIALPDALRVFEMLSSELVLWVQEASRRGRIAYFETEYWGGDGGQDAVVWENGSIIYGPTIARVEFGGTQVIPEAVSYGAINGALHRIGVSRTGELDEFDSIGLGRHRTTEAWAHDAEERESPNQAL